MIAEVKELARAHTGEAIETLRGPFSTRWMMGTSRSGERARAKSTPTEADATASPLGRNTNCRDQLGRI